MGLCRCSRDESHCADAGDGMSDRSRLPEWDSFAFHPTALNREALFQNLVERGRRVFPLVLVARPGPASDRVILPLDARAETEPLDLQVFDLVLHADSDRAVVNSTVLDRDQCSTPFARAAQPKRDLVCA